MAVSIVVVFVLAKKSVDVSKSILWHGEGVDLLSYNMELSGYGISGRGRAERGYESKID